MKGYLIDPDKKEITTVDIDGGIDSIYKTIDADIFQIIEFRETQDVLYIDERATLRSKERHYFSIGNYHSPLIGKSLMLGSNDDGDSVDVHMDIDTLKKAITWLTV